MANLYGIDYLQSPTRQTNILSSSKIDPALRGPDDSRQPEPILSLITSQHPILSTAINGPLSAYASSKSYSPRFRYGAEFVERHIGSPVVNTVGTAGRISGVEGQVRWWLQRGDSYDMQHGSNKRQRVGEDNVYSADIEKGLEEASIQSHGQRRSSEMDLTESLPPYDDQRSPRYEEHNPSALPRASGHEPQSPKGHNWQTRLMMSTSGLGVAMSEESLRSLKYCFSWLRWANNHLAKVLSSLQSVIEEWNQSHRASSSRSPTVNDQTRPARDQAIITQHIQALKGEVLQTLKGVVDVVSKYAGGALPENARVLVRKHLTSLPQRFRIASTTSSTNGNGHDSEKQAHTSETVTNAQKVMVLAKEGLDMMAQVSDVLNGTIVSAEEWCDRLGRRRERQDQSNGDPPMNHDEKIPPAQGGEDVSMMDQDDRAVATPYAVPTEGN